MTDETVYIRRSGQNGRQNTQFIQRYHTDTGCQHVGDDPQSIDRAVADRRGLSLCQRCASDAPRLGGGHGGYTSALFDRDVTDLSDIPQAIAGTGGDDDAE